MLRLRKVMIASLSSTLALLALASQVKAEGQETFEQSLRKALITLKQGQAEKTRATLAGLAEQVQSDLEPGKRLQAAIMLAAHYWESNQRLSRHYLGIAESLRDPLSPELRSYDADIEHMRVRFRQAALLDQDTKRELENQLQSNPAEPLKLSLVEMLLETNEALGASADYLNTFHRYYTAYPRTVRKDRFLKRAAEILRDKSAYPAYFQQLEALLDQYPVSEESKWALEQLLQQAAKPLAPVPRYAFTFGLLKKVYRNSSHDPQQQKRVLELVQTPLRKKSDVAPMDLTVSDTLRLYCYLQIYDEALSYAQSLLNRADTPAQLKTELQNWIAFIYSERGDHSTALVQFQNPAARPKSDLLFQESEAKSYMSSQNFSAAATHYLDLMKKKDQPRYRWYYFWNLLASGKPANAASYISRQSNRLFNETEFRNEAAAYWRGKALVSAGQLDKARGELQNLLERPGYYGILAKDAIAQGLAMAAKNKGQELTQFNHPGNSELEAPKAILASFRGSEKLDETREKDKDKIDKLPYASFVHEVAKTMEIDPYLVLSIIRSESGFNARALSSAGAQGLMQIMPYTAVRLARVLEDKDFRLEQLQSGEMNLIYGSLYLAMLLNYYGGHAIPAVAAYNAGPLVVNKWLRECRNCPVDAFVEFIPYAETRNYVKKVMSSYTGYRLSETHSAPDFLHKELPVELPDQNRIF